jgi:hypothetical protein
MTNWPLHLVYVVDQLPSWTADEITRAWQQIQDALAYWNAFHLPVALELEESTRWECVGVPSLESWNYDSLTAWADLQPRSEKTAYLIHDTAMAFPGFARQGEYVLMMRGLEGTLAHEMGHLLGAKDHYAWSQMRGWHGTTEVVDVMGMGTITNALSWQTMLEICAFLQPQTGWEWVE